MFSRSFSKRLGREKTEKSDSRPSSPMPGNLKRQASTSVNKLKISAPVELISTTNTNLANTPSLRTSLSNAKLSSEHYPGSSGSTLSSRASTASSHRNTKLSEVQYPDSPVSSRGSTSHTTPPLTPNPDNQKGNNTSTLHRTITPPDTPPQDISYFAPRLSRHVSGPVEIANISFHPPPHERPGFTNSSPIIAPSSRSNSLNSLSSTQSPTVTPTSHATPSFAINLAPAPPTFGIRSPSPSISQSISEEPEQEQQSEPIVPPKSASRTSVNRNPSIASIKPSRRSTSTNPFGPELAKVSELADEMGLDLDEQYMVKNGLRKCSAEEYLCEVEEVFIITGLFRDKNVGNWI